MPTSLYSAAPAAGAPPESAAAAMPHADSRWSVGSIYGLVLAASALVYIPVLTGLVYDWAVNPNYSHGFIIPFAVAFFAWQQRAQLKALPARPTQWGLVLAVFSQVVYVVGYLGAEFFLQRTSLLLLLAAAVLYIWGWAHLRVHLFSLTLLFLAIPLPQLIFNAIAIPLQLLASAWAAALLNLCNIPVFREGNILALPQRTLDVAEACSGIRSLFSLIALAMMVAYFVPVRFWLKLWLVLSSVPIALAANALRIMATGLIGAYFGAEYSEGFFHAFSGWLIFVFAFALLLLEASLIDRWRGRRTAPPPPADA
ncbi:MAG TPA: exosortase [Terriglobales bacterium]|nr:exosortase [Terriglobales bacterium]